jgi:hypothetical protein
MPLYTFFLLNVLVKIANKMGLQKNLQGRNVASKIPANKCDKSMHGNMAVNY